MMNNNKTERRSCESVHFSSLFCSQLAFKKAKFEQNDEF